MARLLVIRPVLLASVAFIWLITAFVCLFLYPLEGSLKLLAACGISGQLAWWTFYAACVLDAFFGLVLLLGWRRKIFLMAQLLLVVAYSLVTVVALPEYWLHPFGPLTKNIPLVGAILALWATEV